MELWQTSAFKEIIGLDKAQVRVRKRCLYKLHIYIYDRRYFLKNDNLTRPQSQTACIKYQWWKYLTVLKIVIANKYYFLVIKKKFILNLNSGIVWLNNSWETIEGVVTLKTRFNESQMCALLKRKALPRTHQVPMLTCMASCDFFLLHDWNFIIWQHVSIHTVLVLG